MRKKVLYLITKSFFGGAQRYVYDLATNLPENFEPVVVCGPGGELVGKLKQSQIRVIEIPSLQRDISLIKDFGSFLKIISIIKKENPDILHLNSSKIGGLGALAGRLCRVSSIIFTAHGWPFKESRNIFSKAVIWFASWISALLSTKTIVISTKDMALGKMMPFVKPKIIHIYNGIDNINFLDRFEARRLLAKDLEETIWIGTIAELTNNKNLELLIKSFANIKERKNLACIIIGEGKEREKLEKLIETLGLRQKVRLLGYVRDAAKYLTALDIFVLPSLKEGHPYTVLEAGLAGLPVIGTKIAGITDIIESEKNGLLVHPDHLETMTRSLQRLIRDENLRKELGDNLKKTVQKQFLIQKMLLKTIALY